MLLAAAVLLSLHMEENPLIGEVEEALPKGQCGACGFAGCAKYAEAVVLDPEVPPNLCVPGKAEVATVVANLTGKVAEATEPKYAHIRCRGGAGIAKLAFNYKGVHASWSICIILLIIISILLKNEHSV